MKIDRMKQRVEFRGEGGCSLEICYNNMGEPFREGVQLSLNEGDRERSSYIFIEQHEAKELRDLLNSLYPE